MMQNENNRETGARKLQEKTRVDAADSVSQEAATNKRPAGGMGLTEPQSDVNDKTRHFDGQDQGVVKRGSGR